MSAFCVLEHVFHTYYFYMNFSRLSSLVSRLIPIFPTQKFLTRIILWQRLLFSVTVTSVAVLNAL